ncbi:cell envelope integrity protein TolA [Rhizobium sp. RCC_161_2]|uniref:cell envelope integrity protein TolA n=1 Tax=Rhizobium sp. RCC_161_2 TaxID=3239219 RepID=UPI00352563DE
MLGLQSTTNHCPHVGLSLLMALGMMLTAPKLTHASNATALAAVQRHEDLATKSLREDIAKNWNMVPGMEGAKDVHVRLHLKLSRSGEIVGEPKVTVTGGPKPTQQAIAASAMRAVLRAAPFKNLPIDQYDHWKEVTINFDPAI